MIKKLFVLFIAVFYVLTTNLLVVNAQSKGFNSIESKEVKDPHVPILSAPVGFLKGAYWGMKASAGAFGDESGPFENFFGFILGAPIGAVAGTAAGLVGGPFVNKEKEDDANSNQRIVDQ